MNGPASSNLIMFTHLRDLLTKATTKTVEAIAKKYGSSGIYGFALYTSGDYRYVIDSFSTRDGLTKVATKYLSEESYQEEWGTLEVASRELKWSPCDSPHHGEYDRNFNRTNEELEAIWADVDDDSEDAYIETCRQIHEVFTDVLKGVRQSGVFPGSVVLNVLMGDQSDEERLLNAEQLNPKEVLQAFASELQCDPDQVESLRETRWQS
jgi:hypothetical protein